MDLNVITAIAAVVIVILQIIILANQKKNATLIREFIAEKPKAPQSDRERSNERRDGNFNKNRRGGAPQHGPRPAQAQTSTPPAATVDSVEKSLRDINLKLKNAERDQDVARRKIGTDVVSKDGQPQRQRSGRDGNRDGNRDRDGRDSRGGRSGNNRDRNGRGNNFRNRSESDRGTEARSQEYPDTEADSDVRLNMDVVENTAEVAQASAPAYASVAAPVTAPAALPDLNPTDFTADASEHGRKFGVKRRVLQEEGSPEGNRSDSEGSTQESSAEAGNQSDAEISFGRR